MRSTKHILMRILAAVVSGLLLAAAFPALDWGFLAWIALVPLLCVLRRCSWPGGAAYGLTTGLVFFIIFLYYIGQFGTVPWIALALFQATYYGVAGAAIAALRRCPPGLLWPLAAAAIWTLATYLRGNVGPLSLPFGELGHTQHSALSIAQAASVVGAIGLTFLVALVNAAIAQLIAASATQPDAARRPARACAIVGAFLLVVMLAGLARFHVGKDSLKHESGPWLRAVAVQAEIYAGRQPDVGIGYEAGKAYLEWSARYPAREGLELIVWPEAALVVDPDRDPRFGRFVQETLKRTNAHLLFGHLRFGNDGRLYNAASLMAPDGRRLGEYHKVHLVIFGEYVPYRKQFPFLARFPVRDYDFSPGKRWMTLDAQWFRVGPLICFESLFPAMSREVVRQGADVLVIITSDAWAGRTAEVWQHGYISVFRALEQKRFLIRAGTQGLSCIISPYGEIVAQAEPFTQGAAAADIVTLKGRTIYSRFGDWPLLVLCVLLVLLAAGRRGRSP